MTDVIELLQRASSEVSVSAPPVHAVTARGRRMRRTRRTAVMAGVCALGLAAGGLALAAGTEKTPGPANVVNRLNQPWWADGVLHLSDREVNVADLAGLVVTSDGVVYADESGDVHHVHANGKQELIGHGVSVGQLASNPANGWVSWVDNSENPLGAPGVIVVFDLDLGRAMAWSDLDQHGPRFGVLDEGNYPIAIDGNTVWISAQDGDYEWSVPKQATRQTKPSTFVVDVENLTRLERVGDHARWWGPDMVEPIEVDARPIALSTDGHVGLFSSDEGVPGIELYRDGTVRIDTGLDPDAHVVNSAFGPDGTITYVVASEQEHTDGPVFPWGPPFSLVTCTVATSECETVVTGIESNVELPR